MGAASGNAREEGRVGLWAVGHGSFGEDSVTAVVERLSHGFLSRAGAFYYCCVTDPGRGLVIRFTGDVHCLRGGLRYENPPAVTIVASITAKNTTSKSNNMFG
jgi:hypothetical protein